LKGPPGDASGRQRRVGSVPPSCLLARLARPLFLRQALLDDVQLTQTPFVRFGYPLMGLGRVRQFGGRFFEG
jgi:hypothetical protein